MVVGHNPSLSQLLGRLVVGPDHPSIGDLHKAGIAALQSDDGDALPDRLDRPAPVVSDLTRHPGGKLQDSRSQTNEVCPASTLCDLQSCNLRSSCVQNNDVSLARNSWWGSAARLGRIGSSTASSRAMFWNSTCERIDGSPGSAGLTRW